ncbi:MAG: hypothetical protein F6K56_34795 [Moorea sp. SIO3G5]|nr:hypothetical protein [Moorena sp. SIO3G5]
MGASDESCLTRWVERASWWNGHLSGTGILPVTIPRRTILTLAIKKMGRAQRWCVTGRTF